MTRQLLLTVAALATLGAACDPQTVAEEPGGNELDDLFETEQLVVLSDDGQRHTFNVYVADRWDQHRRGLMFVRELPEDQGMLFVYDRAGVRSMWMKNTYISLDMVFARADGSVSSVIQDTEPLSMDSQSSNEAVSYVLEVNAGVTRRLNIGSRSRLIRQTD